MKTLSYLNGISQTSISVTDNRPAGVRFNRVAPLQAVTQVLSISSVTVPVSTGIEIVEIINGATANVRYRVEIVPGPTSPLPSSSITWASLPGGVSQSVAGNVYTISGIDTLAEWNSVKNFTWNLPANYTNFPLWYLKVSVVYYDGATSSDKTKEWLVYDDQYYYVASMTSSFAVSAGATKAKLATVAVSSALSTTVTAIRTRRASATISSTASLSATGNLMIAILNSSSSMSITAGKVSSAAANINAVSSVYVKGNYTVQFGKAMTSTSSVSATTNDLRIQIYHTADRPTFSAAIQTYQRNLVVYWGDGTSTTYTGTGDYRTHNITKTYTGAGYKDITMVSAQFTQFRSSIGAGKAYIEKVYDWGFVPNVANFHLDDALTNQISLTTIPKYIPEYVTTMQSTFTGCTSLNDPNISSWSINNLTSLSSAFDGCTSFNQPISSWNFSNASSTLNTFKNCTSFNQLVNLTFPNIADARSMFENCTSFNQDLSSLTIGNSIQLNGFLSKTALNQENYNKLLVQLAEEVSAQGGNPTSVTLGVPNLTETTTTYPTSGVYPTGQTARNYLISSPRNWTIVKDGIIISTTSDSASPDTWAEIDVSTNATDVSYYPITVNLSFGGSSTAIAGVDYVAEFKDSDLTTTITSLTFNNNETKPYRVKITPGATSGRSIVVNLTSSNPNLVSTSSSLILIAP
jgi:hypothetical protein